MLIMHKRLFPEFNGVGSVLKEALMKRIVVAVEDDGLALSVVRIAGELARSLNARLTLCHVLPEEEYRESHTRLSRDLHKPFIMRRREIAEEYLINRPHIERIGLMIVGFMLAFLAAISEQVIGIKVWKEVPYLIVIFTIIANEVTMVRWRRLRDKALETVDLEQEHADRRRTGELTPEMTATPPPAPSA